MREFPLDNIIQDIAIELGLPKEFVEKDWYAVEALKIIKSINGKFKPIFSGGTSLSKGFDLIKRFSEDLDFKVIPILPEENTAAGRKKFRELLIEKFESAPFRIEEAETKIGNKSKSVKLVIKYPIRYEPEKENLRPYLKIDISFHDSLYLSEETRQISSFIDQLVGNEETFSIDCVSPTETAADKISAFIWRVQTRDRKQAIKNKEDDPTIIRHLHDLYALKERYINRTDFRDLLEKIYEKDKNRSKGKLTEQSLSEALKSTCKIIRADTEYEKEYKEFVTSMFHGLDKVVISYTDALNAFEDYVHLMGKKSL